MIVTVLKYNYHQLSRPNDLLRNNMYFLTEVLTHSLKGFFNCFTLLEVKLQCNDLLHYQKDWLKFLSTIMDHFNLWYIHKNGMNIFIPIGMQSWCFQKCRRDTWYISLQIFHLYCMWQEVNLINIRLLGRTKHTLTPYLLPWYPVLNL